MSSRICTRCRNALTDSDFYAHPHNKDRLQARCKVCQRVVKAAYQRTPEGRVKHRLYSRRYGKTPGGRATRPRYRQEYHQRHPERLVAGRALHRAVGRGEVERQPCATCGAEDTHAHHSDYGRPLDVTWLCPGCHASADARRRVREMAVA